MAISLIPITDSFSFADNTKWSNTSLPSTNVIGGQLNITPDSSYDGWVSVNSFDFTGKGILLQAVAGPTDPTGGAAGAQGYISVGDSASSGNWFQMGFSADASGVVCNENDSNTKTDGPTAAYQNSMWLRMHESSGVWYWDYAYDGINWINLWSRNWAVANGVTSMRVTLQAGYYTGTPVGTATFDNLNIPLAPVAWLHG
ncbi:MAG: hypothetical protein WDN27_04280 [Candidatus Saccharibacteria bacterium]